MDSNIIDIKVTEIPIVVMDSVEERYKTVPVRYTENRFLLTSPLLGVQYYCYYGSICPEGH